MLEQNTTERGLTLRDYRKGSIDQDLLTPEKSLGLTLPFFRSKDDFAAGSVYHRFPLIDWGQLASRTGGLEKEIGPRWSSMSLHGKKLAPWLPVIGHPSQSCLLTSLFKDHARIVCRSKLFKKLSRWNLSDNAC